MLCCELRLPPCCCTFNIAENPAPLVEWMVACQVFHAAATVFVRQKMHLMLKVFFEMVFQL